MDGSEQRAALAALVRERGVSYAALSRMLRRNAAYLQQFVTRGSPRVLAEEDRRTLARFFGVSETMLGGSEAAALAAVPRFDVGASAGPGRWVEGDRIARAVELPAGLLRSLGIRPAAASIIRVEGDSMLPTLADGDEILVDADDRRVGKAGALYVLRLDGAVMVKRVRAARGALLVTSDNPAAPDPGLRDPAAIDIIARVRWLSRVPA